MLSRFILLMFPNKTLFNIPATFVLLRLLLICWCVGVSQEEVILNEEIGLDVSLAKNSSQIRNYYKGLNKLGSILHHNPATTAATTRATGIIKSQVATRSSYNIHTLPAYGNKDLLTEKRIKDKKVAVRIKNNTCGENGCNSHGSETVLEKQEKHSTEPSVPLSENKDVFQKDDVHIKILDTDARRRRDRSPFKRWWPRRNRHRYWGPSRRDRKWWKRNRQRWRQRQRPNMTTPLPTSTALVDTETGDRRVIITRPGHRERPSRNQTGGSISISQHKGYAYWNVPPFVMKMQRKLQYKIRQMSNMVYNGLSDTLYNITRRSKYIVNKHSAIKDDASHLISNTHDDIEDIVELNNNIYDLVLSISAFHRRLYERLYEQGPSPTPGAIPNITAFVKRDYSGLNREALILLRMMKHMRNKFFHLNHTYAKHINYYYDKLDRIRDVISSQRIRIGDLMDTAMYVNNQMSNLTKLQVPSVLRQIYDERHKLITDNYQSRHQLHITEQVHQDVTTFQKSCQLRLQELTQLNYTLLKKLPKPTTTPLTFKEKRKLQILVNRVKGHTENILKTAAEIDSLLPPVITSAKELILKLSMESQSDSYKVWALGKILKHWGKIASAVHGNAGRRKWMKKRRQRIRRMRGRMPKSKSLISKRNRRAADVLEEDIDKIYEEIIHILTQIIKRLDDMWMKLFEVSSGNIGKCEKLDTEGSGEDDTEMECEVQGSGKMDITESESGTTTSESLAGNNDHDDSNDFEFTDVKTVVVSSHREHLQSIVSASLSQSKKHLKISRNLVNDVQDIKSSLDEVKAKKKKLENNVNKSADTVNIYQELVSNATEMRRLVNETELKINASQVKCLAVQKLADLVLADKDELKRLLEVKKKEKEKERKEKKGKERKEKKEKERKEKEGNEKDKDNKEVRKKKKKKLKDKSNDNVMDLNGRENEEKRRKDKKKDNDGGVEVDASKKELEENERTKSELKALIEKYLRLQKEEEEEEEKRKNEEKGKKKKVPNVEREEVEDKKERKTKKRRRKKSKRDDLGKKNNQEKESVDEQRNKKERNKTGKRRKEDGEEVEEKRNKKKKLTENRKNEVDVNQVTDKNTENETRKKLSEIDMNSVLEIKKNLEDVLKKLNQKLEGSKNWNQRQRRKRRRRKQIELASKKRDKKRSRNKGVMGDKEMINDKETSEELNEKEESGNENEDKKKKKRRKVKNEVEDPKADADEEVKENFEEGWKNNRTERKSRKKDRNEEMNEKQVKKNKEKEKNNEPRKKRRKHTNDENTVIKEDKNMKERGKGDEVKEKKEKKVRDEENDEKKDMPMNLNEKEKSNKGKRKKDKNEKNGFEEDTESNVRRRKKKRKVITKEENKKRDKIKVKKNRMSLEEEKEETDEDKEHQRKDLQEEKTNKVKTRKRKDGTKKENDITDSIENNSKEREKNDLMKEKEEKGEDSEKNRKKRKKPRKNKEEESEKRKKKRKEETKSLYIKNEKDVNETEEEMEGKDKDKIEMNVDNKKKEMLKKRKKSNNSTMTSLVEEGKVRRNGGRSRKFQRKRKKILNEKLQSSPIFIQDEEQSFAKEMKNKTKQIEEDVKKSKMAVESIVKQLKEFFPDPCTSISNNINQLRLNVSQIRQKIQLARTIVSSMKIPVSLNGEQHLEMMLNQKTESREIQTSVEICIKPRTTDSVILSLQANNSISYSLALVDSKPLLTILDVNGEMLKTLEPDTKLIKNNWYQFLIHRNGQNFSLSVNPTDSKYERITVQKFIPDFSPEQIPLSLVSLGGYPKNFPINNSEKLKGCIAYLNVNGHSTRIFSPLKSGLYPSVCKIDSESYTNTSMVFEGNGFALLESDVLKKPFTLVRLGFKTFQKNALLMSIKNTSKMLLIVTLIEGNIHVERRGKTSSIARQSQGTEFSNGQLHTIQVMVIKNQLEIKTSSEKVEFEDKDASSDEMLFDEGISLGGLASNVRNESKYRSYTGCLSNVSIDNTPLNLLYLKDGRHVYQGECQGNVWISCAQFTESSVPVSLTKYDHVRSISLMVSAQAQGVALFFERKDKFSIKLQLTTMSLEVFDYKNDENEIIPKKNESRFWHLLHIEDQQGNIHITLDGEQSVDMAYKENTGWFYSNADDFSMFVTVGGLPKDHEHFKKLDTFIGSISTLFIQHLPINLNREVGSSYNLLVCEKPTVELFPNKLNCTNSVGG